MRDLAPGLARLAAGAWWRTAEWTVVTTFDAARRVTRAALSGESAADLLQDTGEDVRDYARRVLGLMDNGGPAEHVPGDEDVTPEDEHRSLRLRGAELLRQSADVEYEEDAHPAYERILGDLAPDEARILRFLDAEGPQPSVDVRAAKALNVGSEMVAPGLTMIGAQAGGRYLERVPAYLNNLYRLGLIWFSREPLEDPLRYQVLEAQPDVIEAMREAGRGRTVRRSIHLTPFGEEFCRVCLPG